MLSKLEILQYGIYEITFHPDYEHLNKDRINSVMRLKAKQVARLSRAEHLIECIDMKDGINQLRLKAQNFWELANIGREPEKASMFIEPELRNQAQGRPNGRNENIIANGTETLAGSDGLVAGEVGAGT